MTIGTFTSCVPASTPGSTHLLVEMDYALKVVPLNVKMKETDSLKYRLKF